VEIVRYVTNPGRSIVLGWLGRATGKFPREIPPPAELSLRRDDASKRRSTAPLTPSETRGS